MEQIRRRPEPTYEEFQPKSDWTLVNDSDVLLVDLPGFKKEELKVQVDNLGRVMVSGERQVNGNKHSRFRQIFEAPQDSDISKINGRFDGGLLFIYIPRKIAQTSSSTAPIVNEEPNKEEKMKIPENITKEEEKITRQEIKEEEEPKKKPVKVTEEPNYQKEKLITTEERPEAETIRRSCEIAKEGISTKKKDDEEGEVREEVGHDDDVKKEMEKKEKKRRMKAQEKEEMESYIKELMKRKLGDDEKGELREYEVLRRRKDQLQGLMEDAVQEIKKNKSIVITAVLAFSLGFYLSRKFRSNGE